MVTEIGIVEDLAPLEITLELMPKVNLALHQNAIPILRQLEVHNPGPTDLRDVRVRFVPEPAWAEPFEQRFDRLAAGDRVTLADLPLPLNLDYLARLTDRIRGSLKLEVSATEAGGERTLTQAGAYPVEVLAFDEWPGLAILPEILAAFVTPNVRAIEKLLREASNILGSLTGQNAIDGYQSGDRQRVYQIVAAIYEAVAALKLTYSNPPASFEQLGQRVRFVDHLLETRLATCLDTALLFASLCEQAGLHPLLLIHQGHAYAGCWLSEETFPDPVTDDLVAIRKRVELDELVVFETTCVCGEEAAPFAFAEQAARKHLAPEMELKFMGAIDVRRARQGAGGIRPLPLQHDNGGQRIDLKFFFESLGTPKPTGAPLNRALTPDWKPSDATPARPADRLDRWKQKLLDLTANNRLLNFRETSKSIPLLCPYPAALENQLALNQTFSLLGCPGSLGTKDPRSLKLWERQAQADPLVAELAEELAAKRLRSAKPLKELEPCLLELFREARTSLEENGANTLFVALGMVAWRKGTTEKAYRAPILLVPVRLDRKSVRSGFTIQRLDEDTLVNVTLLEMLRRDFGLQVPGVDPLPEDEHGVDVAKVFQAFRIALKDLPGAEVVEEVWLAQFSFNKFLLWKDLQDRADQLRQNRVVDHLINRAGQPFADPAPEVRPEELDKRFRPQDVFCPLSADSSQLAAVLAAAQGRNFVLHGPPGTGKSQTIANLIAHSLAEGKRVLFVAEKQAALNVVHHRLTQLGLGPFCLELHSNKAGKGDVLRQIGEALDFATQHEPGTWQETAEKLQAVRTRLNGYVQALHRRYPNGLSAFTCQDRLLAPGAEITPLSFENFETQDKAQREALRRVCLDLERRGQPDRLPPEAREALEGIGQTDWTPDWQDAAIAKAQVVADALEACEAALAAWMDVLGLPAPTAKAQLVACAQLAHHLPGAPTLPPAVVTGDWPSFAAATRAMAEAGKQAQHHAAYHLGSFRLDALRPADVPALIAREKTLQASWNPLKFLAAGKLWKEIAALMAPGTPKPAAKDLLPLLEAAQAWRELDARYRQQAAPLLPLLTGNWDVDTPDWEKLDKLLQFGAALPELVQGICGRDLAAAQRARTQLAQLLEQAHFALGEGQPAAEAAREFADAWQALLAAVDDFRLHLRLDPAHGGGADFLATWRDLAKVVPEHETHLESFCRWQEARKRAHLGGLTPLMQQVEADQLPLDDLPDAFERSYRAAFHKRLLNLEPTLRQFHGDDHARDLAEFAQLDRIYQKLTAATVVARLSQRLPQARHGEAPKNSELGILNRERVKKSRHMPVRQLLVKTGSLVPLIKPCFLMSPLSVAQYLEADAAKFDLVVFDEASQIPVWDAVGAIARGQQLVVVGDPKQLPPTTFFSRAQATDDDEDLEDVATEDLESILDECLGSGLPPHHLRWHYRSRREGLIAFSNEHYYDRRLQTFPAPDHQHAGVRLVRITGHYDKSRTRTNLAEAEAVVAEVVRRLRDPAQQKLSIGVVTFSQAQQQKILDLLEAAQREFPEIEPFFSPEHPEPVFVKNLENVQGDERDVILFSICYARDATGKVSMNFGPLNRPGGERRLNVAVTRAKHEVVVFASLRSEDIDLTRTKALGARHLKDYLAYAERGPRQLSLDLTARDEADDDEADDGTGFEQQIAEFLRAHGHTVHTQVGCSSVRVDVAVVSPTQPGRYALGILGDGFGYNAAATARDRDRLRLDVLESLGWRLHQVWSTDWMRRRAKAEATLLAAVEAALAADAAPTPPEPPPSGQPTDSTPTPGATTDELPAGDETVPPTTAEADRPTGAPRLTGTLRSHGGAAIAPPRAQAYRSVELPISGTAETFFLPASAAQISQQLQMVIAREGPICQEVLFRRVLRAWGISKLGTRNSAALLKLLPRSVQAIPDRETMVYWSPQAQPTAYRHYRTPGDDADTRRDLDEIPSAELANATCEALEFFGTLAEPELKREIIRRFGFKSLSAKADAELSRLLDDLIAQGTLRREGAGYQLG